MTKQEYQELLEKFSILERLDERSINTYHLIEKLEHHQIVQNGHIQSALIQSNKNSTSIKWVWRVFTILGGSGAVGYGAFSVWG